MFDSTADARPPMMVVHDVSPSSKLPFNGGVCLTCFGITCALALPLCDTMRRRVEAGVRRTAPKRDSYRVTIFILTSCVTARTSSLSATGMRNP